MGHYVGDREFSCAPPLFVNDTNISRLMTTGYAGVLYKRNLLAG